MYIYIYILGQFKWGFDYRLTKYKLKRVLEC